MKFKIDSWYYIKFHDHSKDTDKDDTFILELCGIVEKVTKTHVHLIYWNCLSSKRDKKAEDQNHERASIVLGTIIKKKKLAI